MKKTRIQENRVKKIAPNVDNCPGFSEKRYQMICQIQEFLKEGCSYREIAKRMGVGRNTIAKYRQGNPMELSMYGVRQSKLDPFYDFIIQCLYSGWSCIFSCGNTASPAGREPPVRANGNRLCEFTRVMFCLIHIPHALRCHARHLCL